MRVIAGLGNPGPKHAKQRHNIGFRAVDAIARTHGFGPWKEKFSSLTAEGVVETDAGPVKTLLLKPQTYMNESGRAVGEAARFYKLAIEDIIVVYDEIDLAPGKFRVKRGGGAAGHNGIRSITSHLGADFLRLRMGVGHPGDKRQVHRHVLSDFAKAEEGWVEELCDAVARALPLLLGGQPDAFQTRVTYLAPAPKPEGKDTDDDATA